MSARFPTTNLQQTTDVPVGKEYTVIQEQIAVPVTTTTTAAPFSTGTNFMQGGTGLATPCHPITGATNTIAAAPLGATSTAFPGTTTFEQTSGIPANTHMYGVPVATFEKTGPTKKAPAIPIGTSAGLLGTSSAPVTTTSVESHLMPAAPGMTQQGVIDQQTYVSDSYAPVSTAPLTKITPGSVPLTGGLGAAGIHHHDRAHHHHVHDRMPPTTGNSAATTTATGTGAAAPAHGLGKLFHKSSPTGVAPNATTNAKPLTNEHQIIQDVIPPGRDRVVEHHEKY